MRTVFSNIAWKGLKGRRRATGMMLCVLAAAFALMTAMLCYDSSGAVAMEETRKSIYGEWQIARYALSESEAAEFIQETDPAAVVGQNSTLFWSMNRDWPSPRWAQRMPGIFPAAGWNC